PRRRSHKDDPDHALRRLRGPDRRAGAEGAAPVIDTIKVAVCVFLLAVFQVAATPQITPSTTGPDLVVILVISLALLRGPVWAACAGFAGGVMIDSLSAQSLGLTSLLYVLVAIWASEWAPEVEVAGV